MVSSFIAALIGGASAGLIMRSGMYRLKKDVGAFSKSLPALQSTSGDNSKAIAFLTTRVDSLEESVKRLDLFDESVASITSRFEAVPTRKEVADAFRMAAELEEQRRQKTIQEQEQAVEAERRAELAAIEAAKEEARQAALVEEWAEQQRALIRQEVEQEIAVELDRRAGASVAANPLNARPAAMPAIEPPAGFDQVNRNRFARPLLGDVNSTFPDPFLEGEGGES